MGSSWSQPLPSPNTGLRPFTFFSFLEGESSLNIPPPSHSGRITIYSLPPELLLKVILLLDNPFIPAVLCRHFRDISLRNGSAWREIHLDDCRSVATLPIHLERSGRAKLHLSLSVFGPHYFGDNVAGEHPTDCHSTHRFPPSSVVDIVHLLQPQFHRVEDYHISLNYSPSDERWAGHFLSSFDLTSPTLQVFGIDFTSRSFSVRSTTLWVRIPKLLTVPSFAFSSCQRRPWMLKALADRFQSHSLRILQLDVASPKGVVMALLLAHSKSLEAITIKPDPYHGTKDSFDDPNVASDMEMPMLRSLHLVEILTPLKHIISPKLETLVLASPVLPLKDLQTVPCAHTTSVIITFLLVHKTTLKSLDLSFKYSVHHLGPSLPTPKVTLPSLEIFTLTASTGAHGQPLQIVAPRLITFNYLALTTCAALQTFDLANEYANTVKFLFITLPCISEKDSGTPPTPVPNLARVCVKCSVGSAFYMSLISVGKSRGGLVPCLQTLGPNFNWSLILARDYRLVLNGTPLSTFKVYFS